jgi:endonuclease/exonuclease/phosphatase family metal-dependent hydrolase
MIERTKSTPEITIWTQNLYLGGDIHLGLKAQTPDAFRACVDEVYGQIVASDFPTRAHRLAREIERARPDLIALQEVVDVCSPGFPSEDENGGGRPKSLDYLKILLRALKDRGLNYRTARTSTNALLSLPGDASRWVRITDRDVILVSDRVSVLAHGSHRYKTQKTVALGGRAGLEINFRRGLEWVDVRENYESGRYRAYRLINTHLELAGAEQEAQARELLTFMAKSPLPVIVTGDFNALPTAVDPEHWNRRTTGLTDLWTAVHGDAPGHTFSLRDGPAGGRTYPQQRCDVTFCSEHFTPRRMRLIGVDDGNTPTGGKIWMSDHAGLLSAVSLS